MPTYTHTYTYTYIHTTHTYTLHIHTYIHSHTYSHAHIHARTFTRMRVRTHIHTYIHATYTLLHEDSHLYVPESFGYVLARWHAEVREFHCYLISRFCYYDIFTAKATSCKKWHFVVRKQYWSSFTVHNINTNCATSGNPCPWRGRGTSRGIYLVLPGACIWILE